MRVERRRRTDVVEPAVGGMNISQTVEGLDRYPINIRYPHTYGIRSSS